MKTEHQYFIDTLRECLGLAPLYGERDPRLKFYERFGVAVSAGTMRGHRSGREAMEASLAGGGVPKR